MERKAELPRSNLGRPISAAAGVGEGNLNLTSSTSSSSSLSVSPPDFLSQVNAVFKRHRPLGTMQNFSRATRVVVPQAEHSKSTAADSVDKKVVQKSEKRGGRLLDVNFDQRKDSAVEMSTNPPEDSSITPPSVSGTITNLQNNVRQSEAVMHDDVNKTSLPASSSHLLSPLASSDDDLGKNLSSSAESASITFQMTEGENRLSNQPPDNDHDLKQNDLPHMEIYGTDGAQVMGKRHDLKHGQHADPMTRSVVVGSSCATTMSVHSGPTYQCTHAPLAGHTGFPTQMSSSIGNLSGLSAHILQEGKNNMPKEDDGLQHQQQPLHISTGPKEKANSSNASCSQHQVLSAHNSSSNADMDPSHSSKVEKAPRKKKYDPDVFFKVNGKLYQKLGKIGSGGSSEVHKVITSDCTIYALKKIKLKGRDYPTAYGFCQEIEYLNKLKGKNNIIQLIDYEVTDKTLLQEVINGSMNIKDGRIKDDQYIYMVLEYGEIDLAHMLSQKWKEMKSPNCRIDENWLRFYWQQMLEAVNTIHEERIVHSDLKPANFLLVRGSLKLIDFGIAKAILSDTTNIQRDAQVGTLNYMSPEAFMWNEQDATGNTIKCGRPSDIWSLGCILYQMVYGKTPFAEYKTFWAKFKVITDKNHQITYEPLPNPLLIDLMKRCLAWDRNERWRIPQLLQHPFLLPPVPRQPPPPVQGDQRYTSLLEKIGAYWNDPEVSRLCSELHEAVTKLERAHKS